jgi:hypothetical protein
MPVLVVPHRGTSDFSMSDQGFCAKAVHQMKIGLNVEEYLAPVEDGLYLQEIDIKELVMFDRKRKFGINKTSQTIFLLPALAAGISLSGGFNLEFKYLGRPVKGAEGSVAEPYGGKRISSNELSKSSSLELAASIPSTSGTRTPGQFNDKFLGNTSSVAESSSADISHKASEWKSAFHKDLSILARKFQKTVSFFEGLLVKDSSDSRTHGATVTESVPTLSLSQMRANMRTHFYPNNAGKESLESLSTDSKPTSFSDAHADIATVATEIRKTVREWDGKLE